MFDRADTWQYLPSWQENAGDQYGTNMGSSSPRLFPSQASCVRVLIPVNTLDTEKDHSWKLNRTSPPHQTDDSLLFQDPQDVGSPLITLLPIKIRHTIVSYTK